ncbi:MAG TPA: hypothetical protein VF771_14690 [Longimicrobiaceae bacterium]
MAKRSRVDIGAVIRDRTAIDEAFALAFGDAVRRHRAAGVPMVFAEDDKTYFKDPFDVLLPGETLEANRSKKIMAAVLRDEHEIERASALVFQDAVRRHRTAGAPMIFLDDERVMEVHAFDIPLPEDEPQSDAPG